GQNAVTGLRGQNAVTGLRGPNAGTGLRGPNAGTGLRGQNAGTGLRGQNAVTALLEPRLLARLEALQLATRRRLAGRFAGEHVSTRRGSSPDFADYRQYHPGDDFRRIDYFLYARLDVLVIKLFEAEEDLHLRLLVDTSASMAGDGKLDAARRVAAALGFVALTRRDTVSVHTFGERRTQARRFVGRGGAPALFDHLAALEAGGATPFAAAASHLLGRPGPAGLTVVISDLLTPEWEAAITRLPARGADVVVVHVLAPDELRPALEGDLELVDRETGHRLAVSLAPETLRRYQRSVDDWLARITARCRQVGATYLRLLTTDDFEAALLGGWQRAGLLR
ncbi:MAG: DUF58 domain-containing protein, partial [Acidimicrobiales bacterium]